MKKELVKSEMERFISLIIIIKNPFDYTEWQKNLLNEKNISELSKDAMILRDKK